MGKVFIPGLPAPSLTMSNQMPRPSTPLDSVSTPSKPLTKHPGPLEEVRRREVLSPVAEPHVIGGLLTFKVYFGAKSCISVKPLSKQCLKKIDSVLPYLFIYDFCRTSEAGIRKTSVVVFRTLPGT